MWNILPSEVYSFIILINTRINSYLLLEWVKAKKLSTMTLSSKKITNIRKGGRKGLRRGNERMPGNSRRTKSEEK